MSFFKLGNGKPSALLATGRKPDRAMVGCACEPHAAVPGRGTLLGPGPGAGVGQVWSTAPPASPLVATRAAGSPGAPAGPKPLKPEPTVVTKQALTDYVGILMPLVKGLNDDLLANSIYLDPDAEHAALEDLLTKARALDGCEQGLTCPGWRPEDPEPSALDVKARQARAYRQEAFQHQVDARFMEDRIKAREAQGKKVTNAQIKAEAALWKEWVDFRKRFLAQVKSWDDALYVSGSDFEQLQQSDLQIQAYRARYQALTGYTPTTPLPPGVPEPPDSKIPWTPIIILATAVTGLFLLREIKPERQIVEAPLAARTRKAAPA